MKAISYKQRNGRHRKALCPGAPQGWLCIMNGCQGLRHTWVFPAVLSCAQVAFFPAAALTGWWGPWHHARDTPSESVRTTVKEMCSVVVVQLLSCVQFFATPWTAALQAALSSTISQRLLKFMFIESVMPSNHLILCCPLLLLPSLFLSIGIFPKELALPSHQAAKVLELQLVCSVQFNSVTQSWPTLCNPMNRSTPGLPVHHQLPESTQTHVQWVGDALQPSHPLSHSLCEEHSTWNQKPEFKSLA